LIDSCTNYPLTDPAVIPSIIYFCIAKKKITIGVIPSTSAGSARSHCFVNCPKNAYVASGIVRRLALCSISEGSK